MPRYEITAPDGKRYEIEAPQGASQEAALAYAKAKFAQDAASSKSASPAEVSARVQTGIKPDGPSFGERLVQGLRDPVDAGAQLLTHMLPEGVVSGVNAATGALNKVPGVGSLMRIAGMTPATSAQIDEGIRSREAEYQGRRGPDAGVDWARIGGNAAATLPLAYAVPAGGSMLGRIASGAAVGGAAGALSPVIQGNFGAEKAAQTGMGAAFGGAMAPAAGALARMISPNTQPAVRTLMDEGITPTPGQILGGAAQRTEEKLSSLPIVGDAIKSGQRRGVQEFNRAMYARALEPIGGHVPDTVGREAVASVSQQLSSAYNNLLPRLSFRADPQFAAELARVQAMAATLPDQQARQVERIVREQVIGKLTPQGLASGQTIKEVESELGRLASGYRGDQSFDSRQMGAALQEIQESIRRTLTRANPQHAEELARINAGYSVYARIRDAASRQGSPDGVFSPAQFAAAVRAGDKSVGKGNYARGTAAQQDISDAARSVLGPAYPDSGTAGRLSLPALAGSGYLIDPMLGLGLGAAGSLYLPGARSALAAVLARRPQGAPALAQGVRNVVPLASAAGAPAMYQGSN